MAGNGHGPTPDELIVGLLLARPELLRLATDIEVDHFELLKLRVTWEALRNVEARGQTLGVEPVLAELDQAGNADALSDGGPDGARRYLAGLVERMPADPHVPAVELELDALRARKEHRDTERGETLIAARDAEPDETAANSRDRKLMPLLIDFFGADEPDENDDDDWNIRDIIPREPTLWGGRQKGGKTWAAIDCCIALATGQPWLGFANTRGAPVKTLAVLIEDGKRRLKRRYWELCRGRGIDANDARLLEHLSITREPLRLPDDVRSLAHRLASWKPEVIFVDNLTRVMSGDPNSTRDASAFTKSWLQLGDDVGAAIVMLHHTRKPGGDMKSGAIDPFDALRGSGDFGAAARHMIVAQPIEDTQTSRMYMRGNLDLRTDDFVLGFDRRCGDDGKWVARLTNHGSVKDQLEAKKVAKDQNAKQRSTEEMQRRRLIALDLVRQKGSCSTAQLGYVLSVSPRTAAVTLMDLEADKVLVRTGQKGYAFPPGTGSSAPQQTLAVTS